MCVKNAKIQKVLFGIKNSSCSYQGFDENVINCLIEHANQYLEVLEILGYIDIDNINRIISELKTIDVILPYQFYMKEDKHMVLVDINQYDDNILTSDEKIMLNTYQKIGEYILSGMHYRNIELESIVLCKDRIIDVPDMVNGFYFLIKALSQELAEQVLSYVTGKPRVIRNINYRISEKRSETDFHINEYYQEPACLFSGVLLDDDKKTSFYELSRICLTEDFVEFIASSKAEGIDTLLMGLGCINDWIERKYRQANKASIAMTFLEDSYQDVVRNSIVKKLKY